MTNHGRFGQNNPSVTVYAATANGNVAPVARLAGKATKENQIQYPAVGPKGTLYISNLNGGTSSGSVTESGSKLNGNIAPFAAITGLRTPEGVALDAASYLYVAVIDSLLVFAPGAKGPATPVRDITGSNTLIANPYEAFVDSAGKQYLAEQNAIYTFAPGANGNVAPEQNIQGSATQLYDVLGVAADSAGEIYATNLDGNNVVVFGPTDTGNMAPTLVVSSSAFNQPWGIFIDGADNIYVANRGNNSIAVFAKTTFGTGVPTAVISGSKTMLNNPIGVAVK